MPTPPRHHSKHLPLRPSPPASPTPENNHGRRAARRDRPHPPPPRPPQCQRCERHQPAPAGDHPATPTAGIHHHTSYPAGKPLTATSPAPRPTRPHAPQPQQGQAPNASGPTADEPRPGRPQTQTPAAHHRPQAGRGCEPHGGLRRRPHAAGQKKTSSAPHATGSHQTQSTQGVAENGGRPDGHPRRRGLCGGLRASVLAMLTSAVRRGGGCGRPGGVHRAVAPGAWTTRRAERCLPARSASGRAVRTPLVGPVQKWLQRCWHLPSQAAPRSRVSGVRHHTRSLRS